MPWVRHGFSTRLGGQSIFPQGALNLGFTESDSREAVSKNRDKFFRAIGVHDFSIIRLRQTHSDRIVVVDGSYRSEQVISADAVITQLPRKVLTVLTADCVPLLVVDPVTQSMAAIHAGWRGTAKRIAQKTVEALQRHFGGSPVNFRVAIGPSIRSCCYEVGAEVAGEFAHTLPQAGACFTPQSGNLQKAAAEEEKYRLDLLTANVDQLSAAGILKDNVTISTDCTSCRADLFFSHRRDQGRTGRMMAAIAKVE